MKQCSRCKAKKSISEFHRQSSRADGLHPWCKECACAAARADHTQNRERNIMRMLAWQKANPERVARSAARYQQSDKGRARLYAYRRLATTKAARRAQQRSSAYRAKANVWRRAERQTETYKVYMRDYLARWHQANPAFKRYHCELRRARKLGAPGTASPEQIIARIAFYGGLCWQCRAPYTAIDHVKPLSKGGSHWPANLRPICTSCNSRKGNRWPL